MLFREQRMNLRDFMSWAYEGYTTLSLVWIAASKAFSDSSNDLNALRQSDLKEHMLTKKLSQKQNPTLIG